MSQPDPRILAELPEELRDLPFGSPEFKNKNAEIAAREEAECAPAMRAMPSWINLTGTTICNLKCFMCNQALDPNIPRLVMGDAVYDRVVRELYPFAKEVQFSAFGEPLMTPGLPGKLDDLERNHTKLNVVTNGTLMGEKPIRESLLRVLSHVMFSMDGATEATYNHVRVGADYNEVMANISSFCERRLELPESARPKLGFNYILMNCNVHEAPDFVRLAHSMGAETVTFNHLVVFDDRLKGESLQFDQQRANEFIAATHEVADELGIPITIPPPFENPDQQPKLEHAAPTEPLPAPADPEPATPTPEAVPTAPVVEPLPTPEAGAEGPGMPSIKCYFAWRRAYISVHGEVVPCCVAGMPSAGNMMTDGFRKVWNCREYQLLRSHVYTPNPLGPCRTCYIIYPTPDMVADEAFIKF